MQTIEEETGLNLFLRSGRTIRISQDGQKLAQKVTALLREIDVFEENVREMGNRHGKVSLAVPQQQASLLIPRLLSIFQRSTPRSSSTSSNPMVLKPLAWYEKKRRTSLSSITMALHCRTSITMVSPHVLSNSSPGQDTRSPGKGASH